MLKSLNSYYCADIWRHRAEGGRIGWDAGLLKETVNKELEEEMRLEADQQARNELDRLRSVCKMIKHCNYMKLDVLSENLFSA